MIDALDASGLRSRLRRLLARPLPGADAHVRLSPEPRLGWTPGWVPGSARPSAGLVLLYPREGSWHTVLTLRNEALNRHAGQLSLPGGAIEPGESPADAALREAQEEIGLTVEAVAIVGSLTPLYIPVSGFALHPVVAVAADPLGFDPDPGEVQRLYQVGLDHLRDESNHGEEQREHDGRRYRVPFVRVEDQKLWGATAMVLAELFAVLDAPGKAG